MKQYLENDMKELSKRNNQIEIWGKYFERRSGEISAFIKQPAQRWERMRRGNIESYTDTIAKCRIFNQPTETLSTFNKKGGEVARLSVQALLASTINETCQVLGVKNKPEGLSLDICIENIFEFASNWSIAEVLNVFLSATKGEFGEMYNQVDGPKIMGWLRKKAVDREKYYGDRLYFYRQIQLEQTEKRGPQKPKGKDSKVVHVGKDLAVLIGKVNKNPKEENHG